MNGFVARLAGVSHRYGAARALDDISIAIPAGQMAGLIGPDGVGKSTLLALIAGVRRIQAGSVLVLDGDVMPRETPESALEQIRKRLVSVKAETVTA